MPRSNAGTYRDPVKSGKFDDVREITCEASPALETYTCRIDPATGASVFALAKHVIIRREALPSGIPGDSAMVAGYTTFGGSRPIVTIPLAPGTICALKRVDETIRCDRKIRRMSHPVR